MIDRYYKEDHQNEFVEVEEYGIIKLADIPITLNKDKCHVIDWAHCMNGEGAGKHVLSEMSGCTAFSYGGRALPVVRVVGLDVAE